MTFKPLNLFRNRISTCINDILSVNTRVKLLRSTKFFSIKYKVRQMTTICSTYPNTALVLARDIGCKGISHGYHSRNRKPTIFTGILSCCCDVYMISIASVYLWLIIRYRHPFLLKAKMSANLTSPLPPQPATPLSTSGRT